MPYKIDPEVLARECQAVLDVPLDTAERFSALIERLSRVYPDLIDNRRRRWIGGKAGGILGKVTFLHMGLTEYLTPCTSRWTGDHRGSDGLRRHHSCGQAALTLGLWWRTAPVPGIASGAHGIDPRGYRMVAPGT